MRMPARSGRAWPPDGHSWAVGRGPAGCAHPSGPTCWALGREAGVRMVGNLDALVGEANRHRGSGQADHARIPSACHESALPRVRAQCATRPTAALKASSSTSERVGCVCVTMASSSMEVPSSMALAHSWMRSAAWRPTMCTPRTSRDDLLNMTLATPSPAASARAFELARKLPMPMPSSKPSASALALAVASSRPAKAISGWVKHAAGMALWFTRCSLPAMFSTAEMPWAEAAWASIILPLASPMQ
mmetsp:Transcript_18201/g.60883  ORF Transcript_18201/g.60883 Transcript_18201/m.60883 type:complete len:247 (+) Transcript_18201:111-851(+)